MEFRELQGADVEAVFSILEVIYQRAAQPMGGTWSRRLIELEIENGRGIGLFLKGRLKAFVLFRSSETLWEVSVLATAVDIQRQGLMENLLRGLLASKPSGIELWLEVHEGNLAAQNLYKKLGFHQVGQRQAYYRDGSGALLFSHRAVSSVQG